MKKVDKLQKYAASRVDDKNRDVIWSATTNSAYFHFNGSVLRISDHLPHASKASSPGITMSIIITSNPEAYVLQQHSTGRLSVINYKTAKEIIRSFAAISDIFNYPVTPFQLEKDFINEILGNEKALVLGLPIGEFPQNQIKVIKQYVQAAQAKRLKKRQDASNQERENNHIKTPSK